MTETPDRVDEPATGSVDTLRELGLGLREQEQALADRLSLLDVRGMRRHERDVVRELRDAARPRDRAGREPAGRGSP